MPFLGKKRRKLAFRSGAVGLSACFLLKVGDVLVQQKNRGLVRGNVFGGVWGNGIFCWPSKAVATAGVIFWVSFGRDLPDLLLFGVIVFVSWFLALGAL